MTNADPGQSFTVDLWIHHLLDYSAFSMPAVNKVKQWLAITGKCISNPTLVELGNQVNLSSNTLCLSQLYFTVGWEKESKSRDDRVTGYRGVVVSRGSISCPTGRFLTTSTSNWILLTG